MSKGGQYLTLRPFFQNKCPKNKQQNIQKRAVGDGIVTLRPLSGSVRLQRICAASSYSSPVRWEPPSRRVFTREVLQFKNQVSQIPNTLRTIWLEIAAKIWLTCFFCPPCGLIWKNWIWPGFKTQNTQYYYWESDLWSWPTDLQSFSTMSTLCYPYGQVFHYHHLHIYFFSCNFFFIILYSIWICRMILPCFGSLIPKAYHYRKTKWQYTGLGRIQWISMN